MLITHSVEEAIYLSSRIVVMTARPTRIREIIDVPFAYPRRAGLHETRGVRRAALPCAPACDAGIRGAGNSRAQSHDALHREAIKGGTP